MAGLRDVLLQAIVHRNYGCSDLLAGRDQIHPKNDRKDQPIDLPPVAVLEALAKSQDLIGMGIFPLKPAVYLPETHTYCPVDEVPQGVNFEDLSETQIRDDYLAKGISLPEWFCRPVVSAILKEASPPRFRQGLTIWFTGLSGSGKSTVAHALVERLAEYGRNVSSLDGDEIRTHLSKGLGFSKEDRDANINRVGYVAGLIAQHGGTTICSVISPYRAPRENARLASKGNFVEVYCDTPIEVCESRDVKGHYAKARNAMSEGKGLGFTGVDDPYEAPLAPEVTLDTSRQSVNACVDAIIDQLIALGYILPHGQTPK
jgi:sulfate adenylyltransferase